MDWLEGRSAAGILSPDVQDKRVMVDLTTRTSFPFQLDEKETGVRIGRFVFDPNAFVKANNMLSQAPQKAADWIVVDEVGRLEMDQQEGLAPSVQHLVQLAQSGNLTSKLLLVVRDYLYESAVEHYGIQYPIRLNRSDLELAKQPFPVRGIVLCGGQSVRMGSDKAFLRYQLLPQFAHVAAMLSLLTTDVVVSCNAAQKTALSLFYQAITDSATWINAGPLTGILSVLEHGDEVPILVIGCDYPHLTLTDMKALLSERSTEYDAVCFYNEASGFDEPLLAVYEPSCFNRMREAFRSGNTSLQQFLKTFQVKRIVAEDKQRITSVDTPPAY